MSFLNYVSSTHLVACPSALLALRFVTVKILFKTNKENI